MQINWSIWSLPVGPESETVKRRIFQAPKEETLQQYERLRQDKQDGNGLAVTDQSGDVVFSCS